jgi:pimeloyl-ACP methyl ester carboxylesterase
MPKRDPVIRLGPRPRLWQESRIALDTASLLRWSGRELEPGDGRPVLLIPGFLAGDDSLGLMTAWLRRNGYWTRRAGIRSNVDCSSATVARLGERLEQLVERHGAPVAIIGQSRGGNLARVLAVRRPELVSGIVTLGSPHRAPLAVHPLVRAQVYAVGVLGTLGVPGLFKVSCQYGSCCKDFMADLSAPFPSEVGFVSVYSPHDGIVRWRACLDPDAENVEVTSSHCGMAVDGHTFAAVARALSDFRVAREEDAAALPLAA